VYRVATVVAVSLAVAYGLALPLPYMSPLLALMLSAAPAPPMGVKGVVGLFLVMLVTLGIGLLLTPMLIHYPLAGVLTVAVGLYFSTYLSVSQGKALLGTLLTAGLTIVPAAGVYGFALALSVIQAMLIGMGVAVLSLWVVYPWFPEDPGSVAVKPDYQSPEAVNWIALRVALIVLPPFIMALTNPTMYLKLIMKSVLLGQQGSIISARNAGRELLGSTFLAGLFAILFWLVLKLCPNLWMFFWWMLLFTVYFAGKMFGLFASRYSASFWSNVAVTMLILLGSAVQDSANGHDVYAAFALRMCLFIAVTLYAWSAILLLESWRMSRLGANSRSLPA